MTDEVKGQGKSGKVDDEELRCFASPPCMMHELGPAYLGLADTEAEATVKEAAAPVSRPGTKPAERGRGAGRPDDPPAG